MWRSFKGNFEEGGISFELIQSVYHVQHETLLAMKGYLHVLAVKSTIE